MFPYTQLDADGPKLIPIFLSPVLLRITPTPPCCKQASVGQREESAPVDQVTCREADVAYLLKEVNAYLAEEARVRREDVREVITGIRALVASRADPTDLSREYKLDLHTRGETRLMHVFGGKLTTYLSLSRSAAKLLGM